MILAIDPGYEVSAWVLFDGVGVVQHAIEANAALLERLLRDALIDGWDQGASVVFEQIESFGMAVGREVFETVFWTGRLFEAARAHHREPARMTRRTVKVHLCQSARAQDSNIRVALVDRFSGTARAIGTKKSPGPLYGLKSHEWAALALAVTFWDQTEGARKAG